MRLFVSCCPECRESKKVPAPECCGKPTCRGCNALLAAMRLKEAVAGDALLCLGCNCVAVITFNTPTAKEMKAVPVFPSDQEMTQITALVRALLDAMRTSRGYAATRPN